MKILKDGKLKYHKFTCNYCGCEFVASQSEFSSDYDQVFIGYNPISMCDIYKTSVTLTTGCPYCHYSVKDYSSTQGLKSEAKEKIDKFKYDCDEDGNML